MTLTLWLKIGIGVGLAALLIGMPSYYAHKAKRAEDALSAALERAEQAEAKALAYERAAKIVERHHTETIRIERVRADARLDVSKAAGAETPVPDDLLDAWRSGIDRLRGEIGTDHNPGKPERAVPGAVE